MWLGRVTNLPCHLAWNLLLMISYRLPSAVSIAATVVLVAGCSKGQDSGSTQATTGHVEQAAGSITGDQHLKNQGKKDQVVGDVKSTVHDVTH